MERTQRRSKNHTSLRRPSKLFVHKVLLGLQFLQGLPAYRNGASPKHITRYIKKHFTIDGDISSQVMASLQECVHHGFVQKCDNKYLLVGPIANVQLVPHNSKFRKAELSRVRKIFSQDWNNYNKRQAPDEPKKSRFGFRALLSFLIHVPAMIVDSLFRTSSSTSSTVTCARTMRTSRTTRKTIASRLRQLKMQRECARTAKKRAARKPTVRRSERLANTQRKKCSECEPEVTNCKVRKKTRRVCPMKLSNRKIKKDSLDILFKCRNF